MIRYDVPDDDPRWGKLFRCPNFPIQLDTERQARLRELSNLGALSEKSFGNFLIDAPSHRPEEQVRLQHAYNAARAFAGYSDGRWFLLEGGYGCGKTHLAASIGHERLAQGEVVLFITSPDLLDHLRLGYSSDSEASYDETFEQIRNCSLLILDDLGVENPSAWAKEKLFQLLNHRYTHKLATVITTNADLDRLDARISSRLRDVDRTTHIIMDVPDYRSIAHTARANTPAAERLTSRLDMYRDYTFENFDAATALQPQEHQSLVKIANAAVKFASDPYDKWIAFVGEPGTGKTHLAAAIAFHVQKSTPQGVFFTSVSDLLDDLRTSFDPSATTSFAERFYHMKNVSLLVLDDLSASSQSEWAREKLFQLIDYRYVSRKPTVFTISGEFDKLSERIKTRILDERICSRYMLMVTPYYKRQRGLRR